METREILLKSAQSKELLPVDNTLFLTLDGDKNILNEFDVHSVLDLNEQYNKEREECTKYRLTVTINPYCTNVLCNPTSTIFDPDTTGNKSGRLIVNTERRGGYNPNKNEFNETKMTRWIYNPYKIKDSTSYTLQEPPYKYRIGYDIFDNVYFRTNSIRNGKFMDDTVLVSIPATSGASGVQVGAKEYAFVRDEINSYEQAIQKNLSETNGWLQCLNPSRLLRWEKNGTNWKKSMECVIPYADGGNCEKTDMFPTREMFQFDTICRYENNNLINEENWRYFLTYPYKNMYDHWLVYSESTSTKQATLGIPIIYVTHYTVGMPENIFDRGCFKIQTAYPNNLNVYDKIRIYTSVTDRDFTVQKVINNTTFYVLEIPNINRSFFGNNTHPDNIVNPRLRKIVNGLPCNYYIRQFRKLPNWKFENEKINSNNIKNKLETNNLLFSNTKYKLSYSKTNFDDKLIQITFTDSIDVNLLQDNHGRPLSEIYLTICKNNEAKKREWNPSDFINNNFNPSNSYYETEFQRYWSKNSVGFELIDLKEGVVRNNVSFCEEHPDPSKGCAKHYPNIFYMHNIKNYDELITNIPGDIKINYNTNFKCGKPNTQQFVSQEEFIFPFPPNGLDDVDDNKKIFYYGDICEFDKMNFKETILSKCQHRFNTVNRESSYLHDTAIVIHGIALFNSDNISRITGVITSTGSNYQPETGQNNFATTANRVNGMDEMDDECKTISESGNRMIWRGVIQAGPRPEGYYHQAHYPIKFKWYKDELKQKSFPRIYLNENDNMCKKEICMGIGGEEISYITLFSIQPHRMLQNTIVKIMWVDGRIEYEKPFFITINNKDIYKILIPYDEELYNFIGEDKRGIDGKKNIEKIVMYQYDHDTPLWAKFIGYGSFVWRNIISPSDVTNNSNTEFPLTNGHFYIHKQVNFFLRRQSIGCSSMLFNRIPADVKPTIKVNDSEIYEKPCEIC